MRPDSVGGSRTRRVEKKDCNGCFFVSHPPCLSFPNGDELMFFSSFCMDAGFESLDFLLSLLGDV